MSYFEIGIWHGKTAENVGGLFRAAYQLGASGVFTIGRRYKYQSSDTYHADRHLPLRHYAQWEDFEAARPIGAMLVAVEMGGEPLTTFRHPKQAIYLLGAEDHGLSSEILSRCNHVVSIEAVRQESFNVAVAGAVVMWHRLTEKGRR